MSFFIEVFFRGIEIYIIFTLKVGIGMWNQEELFGKFDFSRRRFYLKLKN